MLVVNRPRRHEIMRPFIMQYCVGVCRDENSPLVRYNPAIQRSEVWTAEGWLPVSEYRPPGISSFGTTRKTGVGRETTDED